MTTEEVTTLTAERERLGLMWAGPSLIDYELRKPGLTGAKVGIDHPVLIPFPEVTILLSLAEATAMGLYLRSSEGAGMDLYLRSLDNLDVTKAETAMLLGYLATEVNVISMDSVVKILDYGKRLQTRSEELFGRQLTIEELTEGFDNGE